MADTQSSTIERLLLRLPKEKRPLAHTEYQAYRGRCKKMGAPAESFRNFLLDLVSDPEWNGKR